MKLVKICGITNEKEVEYLNRTKVDFAGFVQFVPKSKRNIETNKAKELIQLLNPNIKSVAVTISPDLEQIEVIQEAGFDYIQIHGTVDDYVLERINIPVIKAFNVNDLLEYERFHQCEKVVGYIYDAQIPGSGKVFDWSVIEKIKKDEKFALLAGGLNCDNVMLALNKIQISGVDTSSGVENDNGIGKNKDKIEMFVKMVKEYDGG
ncbi:MAG: phosphoribosylanthranilate isomerase [Lachnospiraceae bacterium]|nr:phosphoribosylanthranilate isomerase [Lachnospiraceae bacterium]